MLSDGYTEYLDQEGYSSLSFKAYTVNNSSTGRTFLRNANLDIPTEFIDAGSIHYEAALSTSLNLEPGGVVPATIRCHVYGAILDEDGMHEYGSKGGTIRSYTEIPAPESANDYNLVFLPVIRMHGTTSVLSEEIPLVSHMIITSAVRKKDYSYDLTFQDERVVLDRNEIDMSGQAGNYFRITAQNAFISAGFPGTVLRYSDRCYPGTVESGMTEIMTARQVLSNIMQLSGCFIRARQGTFSPVPLFSDSTPNVRPNPDCTISKNWVLNTDNIKQTLGIGRISSVYVYAYQENKPKRKYKTAYVCSNNPFVTSDNKSAIRTLLQSRLRALVDSNGVVIECLFYPVLEPGDIIKYGSSIFVLSRIEWEGGLFCKLYGTGMNEEYV